MCKLLSEKVGEDEWNCICHANIAEKGMIGMMLAWTDLLQSPSRVLVCMYLVLNCVVAPNVSRVKTLYNRGPGNWYSCGALRCTSRAADQGAAAGR